MTDDNDLQERLYSDLDAPVANEEVAELDQQQMLQMMFQQNQMIIQWMKEGGKRGKGGFAKGHGKEPAQVMKPTAAPAFGGAGYEAWRKRVREWESVHFALHQRHSTVSDGSSHSVGYRRLVYRRRASPAMRQAVPAAEPP